MLDNGGPSSLRLDDRLTRRRTLVSCLLALLSCLISFEGYAQSKDAASADGQDFFEYKEEGVEFKIRIPPLWTAEPGLQRYAVVLKPTSRAPRMNLPGGLIADPTISVATVKKPIEFNQRALEETAFEIEESFKRHNGEGSGFQIFQKNIMNDLPGGRSGLLYYVSFMTDGVEAGQAILLTGNDKVRFRVTLSDHRLNFDRNLELYYPYMVSLEPTAASFGDAKGSEQRSEDLSQANQFLLWGVGVLLAGIALGLRLRFRRAVQHRRVRRSSFNHPARSKPHSEIENYFSAEPENSQVPESSVRFSSVDEPVSSLTSQDGVEPAFSERDLSGPPESLPLSQVVNEQSAPRELKKKWTLFSIWKK
jgi:hypothetical protein